MTVLRGLARGWSAAGIASHLHISRNTLKTHLWELYRRLGVSSREQAVIVAEQFGLPMQ